ncbi:primase-helicase family protein [Mongoliibacter ruber]|uniref:NrS-1 polymerase-like helicase domain-containing protein n=1 Tax=Mongoliibacter ruber TaxID=1750599 RepID=A0A2T0WVA0_9BACT|nr:primase-helicase family protein [Mongoliibacter ruber]PRY90607.1 hypothetical protein CLW00_101271 [Mongoliibacter ruber]
MSNPKTTIPDEAKLYYEERLRGLGITEEINTITSPDYEHGENSAWIRTTKTKENKAFEIHEKGIQINYFLPTGYPIDWKPDGLKWSKNFSRIRLTKENTYEKDGNIHTAKYHQEKGSPLVPYLTPGVIKAYNTDKKIETLVLVEGEFKAFKAWMVKDKIGEMENWEFVGIPGIHGFYGGDTNHRREINEIIQQIILDCEVKNIVMLLDADTLTVKWKDNKDLRTRPMSFANAVANFRNSLHLLIEDKSVNLTHVYFMHLKTKMYEHTKGLDDLLVSLPAKQQQIMDDLSQLHFAKTYFDGLPLTDGQTSGIYRYFGTNNQSDFYAIYKEYIGSRPFIFNRTKYEWTGEELKYVKSEEADRFARIGINWIKRVRLPNHRGITEERIEKWSVTEIKRDYPKHQAEQMINKDIPRFDGFFSLPSWDPKGYRRTIYGCYNLMEPLMWDPKPGRIDTTLGFVKHLFQGEGKVEWDEEEKVYKETAYKGDQFTIALDYLTILHQHPTQKTFVPCLVSKDQKTGKSTFLEWLCMVYNGNGIVLNNDQFKKNFNAHWASKFIIGLDEGFLDVEKKAERERLKQMVTAKEIFMELKGIDVKPIPYFGHLIICSNDADNLMKMEEEDTRWFVVKVKKTDKEDPDLENKLKTEIPAWISFLSNRKIFHKKTSRLWFDPKDFETDQMRKIIEVTKARLDVVVENWIKDLFLTYKLPSIRVNRKTMLKYLNDPALSKYRIDEKELKYYLEEKKGMKYLSPGRCKLPTHINGFDSDNEPRIAYIEETQRHYLFKPDDWLTPVEYQEFRAPFEFSKHEEEDSKEEKKTKEFAEAQPLDNKQYKQEELWDQRKGPAPF